MIRPESAPAAPSGAAVVFGLVGEMARAAQRAARHSCTTRCQRVAEAVFALDFSFVRVFVRVEHVERVVARGLLDNDHHAAQRIQAVVLRNKGTLALSRRALELDRIDAIWLRSPRNDWRPPRNRTLAKFYVDSRISHELQRVRTVSEPRHKRQRIREV